MFRLFYCFLILHLCSLPAKAQSSMPQKKDSLVIVSWNIQMLPNFFGMFSKHLRKKQKVRLPWIIDYCKNQTDWDVIVFQEVFDIEMKRKLHKSLKEDYPYAVKTKTTSGRMTSNGVYIVSRYPMKYIDHIIYPKGVKSDKMAAKGCTLVEVTKNNQKFQIAGTHLQSERMMEAQEVRDTQYQLIRAMLDEHLDENVPQFVVGDMNTEKSMPKRYQTMLTTLNMQDFDLNDTRPYTIDSTNTWNPSADVQQLDYVLFHPNNTSIKVLDQQILRPQGEHKGKVLDYADHYGVKAVIEFE